MVKFSFPKLLLQKKKTNLAILSMLLRYTQVTHKNIERELFIPYPISPTTSVFHLSPLWTECTYAVLHQHFKCWTHYRLTANRFIFQLLLSLECSSALLSDLEILKFHHYCLFQMAKQCLFKILYYSSNYSSNTSNLKHFS